MTFGRILWVMFLRSYLVTVSTSSNNVCTSIRDNGVVPVRGVCTKTWMVYVHIALSESFDNNTLLFSEVLWVQHKMTLTMLRYCATKFTQMTPYVPCGNALARTPVNSFDGQKTYSWGINVQRQFALNLTFLYFSSNTSDLTCPTGKMIVEYKFDGEWCRDANVHCGYKSPWTMLLPSHLVYIVLVDVKFVIHPFVMHFMYQVIDKCHRLRSLVLAHVLLPHHLQHSDAFIQIKLRYKYVLIGLPGYQYHVTTKPCLARNISGFQICDGPGLYSCINVNMDCSNTSFSSFYFLVFWYFDHDLSIITGNLKLLYNKYYITPRQIYIEKKSHIPVISEEAIIYHQNWSISTLKSPAVMSFDVRRFEGFTDLGCGMGGFVLTVNSEESNFISLNGKRHSLFRRYGPFCGSSTNVPFLGGKLFIYDQWLFFIHIKNQ